VQEFSTPTSWSCGGVPKRYWSNSTRNQRAGGERGVAAWQDSNFVRNYCTAVLVMLLIGLFVFRREAAAGFIWLGQQMVEPAQSSETG